MQLQRWDDALNALPGTNNNRFEHVCKVSAMTSAGVVVRETAAVAQRAGGNEMLVSSRRQHFDLPVSQESWYEKLQRWDEALEAYEKKYRSSVPGSASAVTSWHRDAPTTSLLPGGIYVIVILPCPCQ